MQTFKIQRVFSADSKDPAFGRMTTVGTNQTFFDTIADTFVVSNFIVQERQKFFFLLILIVNNCNFEVIHVLEILYVLKGQLILKCPFGDFKSPKKSMKFFPGFLP
jgi:hypothetical protein